MGFASVLAEGVRTDLQTLHTRWMTVVFDQLAEPSHPVLGGWRPESAGERAAYWAWALLGACVLVVLYPLALFGFATRFYVRRFDRTSTRLGVVGTVLLVVVVWGALTAVARVRFSTEGFVAVAAAGSVAVVATVLALAFSRVGGRVTTVLFAYPLSVTALFLPPVVAALYSPTLADIVFPRSTTLAEWLLDNVLAYRDVATLIRERFDLEGYAYVGMWAGISVPIGWGLGVLVTLANIVRPSDAEGDEE